MSTKWSAHLAPNLKHESNKTSLRTLNTEVFWEKEKKFIVSLHAWSDWIMQLSGNNGHFNSRRVSNNKEIKKKWKQS